MTTMAASSLQDVAWEKYDFVDLGCSKGGSIRHCVERFDVGRGLGVDLDPAKVERTREAGFDALVADAAELRLDGQVSFVSMLDFCEHLPNLEVVREVIAAAANSARDFLYIKHPSFEGQQQVEAMGLRQYWWDWHGHTAHIRVADYCRMFEELGLNTYMIRYLGEITHSRHPSIVPTSTPRDLSQEAAAAIVEVPDAIFSPPLWRRQDIFVALRPFERGEWASVVCPTASDRVLMGETEPVPDPDTG